MEILWFEVWCFLSFVVMTGTLAFGFFSSFYFRIVSAIKLCLNSTKLARISLSPTTFTWFLSQSKSVSVWQLTKKQLSKAPA